VKKQETLHGGTAAFLAAIANALSRNISVDRMHELASSPSDLKRLLLPLVCDGWIQICPLLQNDNRRERLVYLSGFTDIQKNRSGQSYGIQSVIEVAKANSLGFLTEWGACAFAEMISLEKSSATSKHLTGLACDIYFPFVRVARVYAWVVRVGTSPELVEINRTILFGTTSIDIAWYFCLGVEGEMDEYIF
jgi:hypothetical protein